MHLAVSEATMRLMTEDKVKRRLTTVLCADVHGYSRLMGADEAGTLGTLRRHRSAIAGLVERHESYRQILVTAGPVRRRRLWADGQRV
jgi:adenylate cyclase